ncbi:MAG: hypothetical protein ACOY58_00820, partial [Candidatus Micrarchaeota archaeon]
MAFACPTASFINISPVIHPTGKLAISLAQQKKGFRSWVLGFGQNPKRETGNAIRWSCLKRKKEVPTADVLSHFLVPEMKVISDAEK